MVLLRSSPSFYILVCCCTLNLVLNASENVNAHSHRSDNTKERINDGAFGSQNPKHYKNGEHRDEYDHESILGSRDVAEEFDHLPPEEAKKRLEILSTSMDKNKDWVIDKHELKQWILQSFKMLNKEDSNERHEESDSNSDGFVTWEEYVEENYGIGGLDDDPELELDENMAEEKRMLKEDKELFIASDLDKDNKLSKNEFLSFSHPEEFQHTREIIVKRTLGEKDINKDGHISFSEYIGDGARGRGEEWLITEKDKFDSDYDKNGDGKLDLEEVLNWLSPDEGESADQEADHLIENADDDLDGVLTIKEIVNHHDIFVGSEATDYGQHLYDPLKFKDEL